MTLTPLLKFLMIAFVFVVNVMLWIWTGIQADAFALGLNAHVYNIVNVIISGLVTAGSALLAYLGLKSPLPLRDEEGETA